MSDAVQPSSSRQHRLTTPSRFDSDGFWDRIENGDLKGQMEIFFQLEREQGVHFFETTDEKELKQRLAEDEYFSAVYRLGQLLSVIEWCHNDLPQINVEDLEDIRAILKYAPATIADANLNFSSFMPTLLPETEKAAQYFLPLVERKIQEHAPHMGR